MLLLCGLFAGCSGGSGVECDDGPVAGPPQRIVVLMDATDGLSPAQRQDIWSRIRPLADRAPPDSVFHLFEVRSDAPGGFREVATVERPPHPCEVDHWTDNPDQRAAQWAPRYLRPLRDALGVMARATPSESSAILQAIQAAARRFDLETGTVGHLVLVSDLLQNVGVDFYRGVPAFSRFRESAVYREVRTRRLEGVELTVLRLPPRRPGVVDEEAVLGFWTSYFTDQGLLGAGDAFVAVEGAPR